MYLYQRPPRRSWNLFRELNHRRPIILKRLCGGAFIFDREHTLSGREKDILNQNCVNPLPGFLPDSQAGETRRRLPSQKGSRSARVLLVNNAWMLGARFVVACDMTVRLKPAKNSESVSLFLSCHCRWKIPSAAPATASCKMQSGLVTARARPSPTQLAFSYSYYVHVVDCIGQRLCFVDLSRHDHKSCMSWFDIWRWSKVAVVSLQLFKCTIWDD